MKKNLIIATLLFTCICIHAQTYHVASVNGNAYVLKNGERTTLTPREILRTTDVIEIGKNSSLAVVDKKESKLYSLKETNAEQLSKVIKSQSKSAINKFAGRFIESLTRGDTEKISYEATVSYKDMAEDLRIYTALKNAATQSAYPVLFTMIEQSSGQTLKGEAAVGDLFFFRITNKSATPLYINILNISSDGSMYDCLPIDVGGTMLHLLVPGYSTVDLKQYPMEFTEPKGEDSFTLIAHNKPFDLRNVIQYFRLNENTSANKAFIGTYKLSTIVK
ncbi:hypothetical protein D0T49_10680 [Paludibacter sp. 221]|uniref:DUF4384 domain-containing protein n=1 Tax=Paludibacter sp. 221 TaxID=2302939 RepID=UPI0013D2F7D7|nr:DUF4384 domain-containing protein [Paludibacter sp. 221]NDV47511.1 hypothetical protein [Paludibacter sp. 221]